MEADLHVAENPSACVQPPSLSILHRLRASRERLKFIRVPNYVWCAIFTGIGGFIFGFDTGSIGPITVMPQFEAQFSPGGKHLSPTIQGLIVSCILLTASLASLFSGPLSDRISRTRTISLGASVFAVGSAIACSAKAMPQLFVGRCVAGVGEGLFLSVVTVYAVEIAPASSRGRLGSVVQLFITIGIASGYFVCYGTVRASSSLSWRVPFGVQVVVCTLFALGAPLLPHSPRWLRHIGRVSEAEAAWMRLGVGNVDAEKTDENVQRENTTKSGWWKESQQMWKKGVRTRTALGVFLMAMQQASGIDGVLYYAPVLFSNKQDCPPQRHPL
ncbi:general substrate transporter [Amylocystis lapponica]|nr:general substrate transporter [Amylocystis lapponica]